MNEEIKSGVPQYYTDELAKLKAELLEADNLIKQLRECSSLSCETCINNVDEYLGE